MDAKHDFDRCSKLIKAEMARFELERVEDFKIALQTFLDGMISRQKEVSVHRFVVQPAWERANLDVDSSSLVGKSTNTCY